MKSLLMSGEKGPAVLQPPGPTRLSLAIEDRLRAVDVEIAQLEEARSTRIKCCDGLGAARLMQDILRLEYLRRGLRLRLERAAW